MTASLPDGCQRWWGAAARSAAVVASGLCLAHVAVADDSSSGVPLRILSAPQDGLPRGVQIARSAVRMEGDGVTVSLAPAHALSAPVSLLVQGPLFGWLGDSEPYPDRQFPELRLLGNGRPVAATESFRAVAGAADVSGLLRQAGVDPWLIADTPPFVPTEGMPADLLDRLVRAGALGTAGSDYLAQWSAQRTLAVALVPGEVLEIRYRLRPGYAQLPPKALADAATRQRYCLAQAQWEALRQQFGRSAWFIARRYEIPVGAERRVPSSVRLSVVPQPGVALVAACTRGGVRPSGPAEWTDIEVLPDQRAVLHVLTLEPATP